MQPKIVDKPWGYEQIIVHTNSYVMKKIFIKAGHRLSKQFHVQKDETVYVSKGVLLLDLSEMMQKVIYLNYQRANLGE